MARTNRQFLIDHLPTGQARPRSLQPWRRRRAGAEGRRGAAAHALHLARRRQPRLDVGRDLSRRRQGRRGDGRRRAGRSGGKQGARHLQAGRSRLRRHGLAGLRGAACKASAEARHGHAHHLPDERLWRRRTHRLFRPARMRPAQGRRDRRRLRCSRLGGHVRRARSRRSKAAARSASQAGRTSAPSSLRSSASTQLSTTRPAIPATPAARRVSRRDRRLFRQCRRRHSRSLPVQHEEPRPHRLLRRGFAIRRPSAARSARRSRPDRHQAAQSQGLRGDGLLRPEGQGAGRSQKLGRERQAQGLRGHHRRLREPSRARSSACLPARTSASAW